MIPTVQLPKSGINTSQLGFGTSRLHYLDRRRRQRLLAAAVDLGLTHFDTAPAYGDGLAETEIGIFLKSGRRRLVIATKYGIPANWISTIWPSPAMRAAKSLARYVWLGRNGLPALTATKLRESAEASLRRLRTDWVDILLLHEPYPERLEKPGELLEELNKLQQRGLIRAFGVAGSWGGVLPVIKMTPEFSTVVQTAESEWPYECPPDVTYGATSAGQRQSYFARSLRREDVSQRLQAALRRRPGGVVLVSTTKIEHLSVLVKAVEETKT